MFGFGEDIADNRKIIIIIIIVMYRITRGIARRTACFRVVSAEFTEIPAERVTNISRTAVLLPKVKPRATVLVGARVAFKTIFVVFRVKGHGMTRCSDRRKKTNESTSRYMYIHLLRATAG